MQHHHPFDPKRCFCFFVSKKVAADCQVGPLSAMLWQVAKKWPREHASPASKHLIDARARVGVCLCAYATQVMYKEGERLENCGIPACATVEQEGNWLFITNVKGTFIRMSEIQQERQGRASVICSVLCV
jgi:hypothetical protein